MFCPKRNTNHQFLRFPNHKDVGANDSRKITIFVLQNDIFLYFYIETRKKTLASHELRDAWGCRTRGQKDQRCRRECHIFIYLIFDASTQCIYILKVWQLHSNFNIHTKFKSQNTCKKTSKFI